MDFPHKPGDLVAVTVVGRVRRLADGVLTVEVDDPQEPVLRVPLASVTGIAAAPADTHAVAAYDWATPRQAVRL